MIHWWLFPLFFTILSLVVALLSLLGDRLTNRYIGQEVAHAFAWGVVVIINLAVWLAWVVIYK